MDNLIYILFVSVSVPIMLMAGLIEKKARQPIVFVLIGIFISVFAAEVNGLLCALLPMTTYEITVIVTPISEEISAISLAPAGVSISRASRRGISNLRDRKLPTITAFII